MIGSIRDNLVRRPGLALGSERTKLARITPEDGHVGGPSIVLHFERNILWFRRSRTVCLATRRDQTSSNTKHEVYDYYGFLTSYQQCLDYAINEAFDLEVGPESRLAISCVTTISDIALIDLPEEFQEDTYRYDNTLVYLPVGTEWVLDDGTAEKRVAAVEKFGTFSEEVFAADARLSYIARGRDVATFDIWSSRNTAEENAVALARLDQYRVPVAA